VNLLAPISESVTRSATPLTNTVNPLKGNDRIDLKFKHITTSMEMSNTFTPVPEMALRVVHPGPPTTHVPAVEPARPHPVRQLLRGVGY
jgi:septal ring-binding cell division protein DamX